MVLFGGCLAASALVPSLVSASPDSSARLVAASTCLLGAGFGAVLFYSSSMTLIQLAAPDHLRGRIMGIWMIVYSGSVPFGALWTGRAAQSWGVSFVMGFSALLCVAVGLIVWASGVLAPAGNSHQGVTGRLQPAAMARVFVGGVYIERHGV